MLSSRHAAARPTTHAPRFGRRPIGQSKTLADRFRPLALLLAVFAILAIATVSLRLVIWMLALH